MKILIACEYSGKLRDRLIDKGHDVMSCDLLPGEGKWTHYHFQGRVQEIISFAKWDMMIGHPPCTYTAVSGNRYYHDSPKRQEGIEFFKYLFEQPIPKICLEHPVSVVGSRYLKATQWIQPWQFGHPETKKTGLWLKGLPKLKPTKIVEGREQRIWYMSPSKTRSKDRSLTYDGIADAMVDQWGNLS